MKGLFNAVGPRRRPKTLRELGVNPGPWRAFRRQTAVGVESARGTVAECPHYVSKGATAANAALAAAAPDLYEALAALAYAVEDDPASVDAALLLARLALAKAAERPALSWSRQKEKTK